MTCSILTKLNLCVSILILIGASNQVFLKCNIERMEVKSCGIYQGTTEPTGDSIEDIEIDKDAHHVVFVVSTDESHSSGDPKVVINNYVLSELFDQPKRSKNLGLCPFIKNIKDYAENGKNPSLYHTGGDISPHSLSDNALDRLVAEQNSHLKAGAQPLQKLRVGVIFCGGSTADRADTRKKYQNALIRYTTASIHHGFVQASLTVPYILYEEQIDGDYVNHLVMFQRKVNTKLRVHAALCSSSDITPTFNELHFTKSKLVAVLEGGSASNFVIPVKSLNFFSELDCGVNTSGYPTNLAKFKVLDSRSYKYADSEGTKAASYTLDKIDGKYAKRRLAI